MATITPADPRAPTAGEQRALTKCGEVYLQIKRLTGDTMYNNKTQEKQADLLTDTYQRLSLFNQILAGVTTGSLILAIFRNSQWESILGAFFGTLNFIITLRMQAVNYPKLAANHSKAAQNLWPVRERLKSLMTDMHDEVPNPDDVRTARELIVHDLATIFADAPRTSGKALALAQKALKGNEHTYTEDELRRLTS